MPTLHILEFASSDQNGLHRLPAIASQVIPIGATSAASAPFSEGARAVRICADADWQL